ncbi:MAG: class I SAM-dependent methyltransferase [Bacteroidota bacterium]
MAYTESQKNIARRTTIEKAVDALTNKRHVCTVSRKTIVRDIKRYLSKHGSEYDKKISEYLSDNDIEKWEDFYNSIVGIKKSKDLKVAYLSGPNPENDLKVFVENGILPENVCAFESDNTVYDQATMSALNSEFPFIKIYRGRIEQYLKLLPPKFDIIYLDFCGTIASSKTISVIREIFNSQRLSSPGVLITNFSLPSETDPRNSGTVENLNLLAANYLYPKPFTEKYSNLGGSWLESAEVCGIEPDQFFKIAKRNQSTFYSQFITRILFDLPSVIVPYQKLALNPNLAKLFFKDISQIKLDEEYYESCMTFPNAYPLIWGLTQHYWIQNDDFTKFLTKFNNQLSLKNDEESLVQNLRIVDYLMSENTPTDKLSEKLNRIRKDWKLGNTHIFCDVFLFHQLKDILIGQLTYPYFYNVDFTLRWTYKAKETDMFMDLVTYDQCRYIFDWMPTLDMFEEGVYNMNRQLALRFAMDSLSKHNRWYNDEFFSGTAVIDQNEKTFEARELKRRVKIK